MAFQAPIDIGPESYTYEFIVLVESVDTGSLFQEARQFRFDYFERFALDPVQSKVDQAPALDLVCDYPVFAHRSAFRVRALGRTLCPR
jgi:hypothetical protein